MSYNLKINILSPIKDSPWGGGNQFLKLLKKTLRKKNLYSNNINEANVIIANSYQDIDNFINIKKNYPDKKIVYRLGPIFHYHRRFYWKLIDKLIILIANNLSDQVIFQSKWSKKEADKLGFKNKNFHIIHNASDPTVFKEKTNHPIKNEKIKLITTSWSKNINKGFLIYQYLDENLNFNKYEMTFIGNSPLNFKNIKMIPPTTSNEISNYLKESDIFISASKDDACSNSIIEALSCKIPVIALDSGGNKEIIKLGGLTFNNKEEIPELIEKISHNYNHFITRINTPSLEAIYNSYLNTCHQAINSKKHKLDTYTITRIKIIKSLFLLSKKIFH